MSTGGGWCHTVNIVFQVPVCVCGWSLLSNHRCAIKPAKNVDMHLKLRNSTNNSSVPQALRLPSTKLLVVALIRLVRNFSKSLTSKMLSSTGCLGREAKSMGLIGTSPNTWRNVGTASQLWQVPFFKCLCHCQTNEPLLPVLLALSCNWSRLQFHTTVVSKILRNGYRW